MDGNTVRGEYMNVQGENWEEYEFVSFEPVNAMKIRSGLDTDVNIEPAVRRAINKFLMDNPDYTSDDVTDIVIDIEDIDGPMIKYKTTVSYLKGKGEQV